ncbi:ComEA family DNA-binding protein [Vogesella sp. DC21W]|uniref:ComEA family DNA-binding protein n=1 Tax=Vogesella aquatica TaxID=2984206 RepID=A0ABT5IX59_9NEIS|nr:ComEA family DNA-binding protein [Vogesella aquatica]MDC7717118.1 ComEA family DNA-binding protein [Vogesella aquatica]
MLMSVAALAAVNINTATQQELETLKGIGPVKAKAIIDYRAKNGPFKSQADLVNVPGIGEKTVEKLKADLAVSGSANPAAAKVAAKGATATATAAAQQASKQAKAAAPAAPVPAAKKP